MLNRQFGIDINSDAIALSKERLDAPFKTTSNQLKVEKDAYNTKTEEELSVLRQFDCDIVQRNKGIDAFLKKYYQGKPVAIRLQKKSESLSDAIQLLDSAGKKKKCSFSVLIINEPEITKQGESVPYNMIILPRYQVQLESALKGFTEQR